MFAPSARAPGAQKIASTDKSGFATAQVFVVGAVVLENILTCDEIE